MAKFFSVLVISFFAIFLANIVWAIMTFIILIPNGMQYFVSDRTFFENIAISRYLKWILLVDLMWIISFLIYLFSRKNYRVETEKHFLTNNPIINPKICVIIPAYNEETTIKQVVNDYRNNKFVSNVFVIDNHSDDKTVELAKIAGAKVITKSENRGFAHSIVMGFKEALDTDANIIALTEADGSLSANDLYKMVPYLDHCDVVDGSRQVQLLAEKGNPRDSAIHIWGHYFLAKLIQLKYLNWSHMGSVILNDVGCMQRIFRKETIEKIHNQLNYPGTDVPIGGVSFPLFLIMKILEKDLRIIEIPISYSKSTRKSKIGSDRLIKNLQGGLNNLWIILKY